MLSASQHLLRSAADKMFQFSHVFVLGNLTLRHIGKSLLPAGGQLRIQKGPDGYADHVENIFAQQSGGDDLCFFI